MFDWIDKTNRKTGSQPQAQPQQAAAVNILGSGDRSGFVAGTHVISDLGWRPVETLNPGDQVLTFDRGMRPLADIRRYTLASSDILAAETQRPLLVPEGAMQNRRSIWLMPDQGVILECDTGQEGLDDPFAVVPAHALAGFRGIRTAVPSASLQVTALAFDCDEMVLVEGGMLSVCASPEAAPGGESPYKMQTPMAARYLIKLLAEAEETGDPLIDHEDFAILMPGRTRPVRSFRAANAACSPCDTAPTQPEEDLTVAIGTASPSRPTLAPDAPRTPRPRRRSAG